MQFLIPVVGMLMILVITILVNRGFFTHGTLGESILGVVATAYFAYTAARAIWDGTPRHRLIVGAATLAALAALSWYFILNPHPGDARWGIVSAEIGAFMVTAFTTALAAGLSSGLYRLTAWAHRRLSGQPQPPRQAGPLDGVPLTSLVTYSLIGILGITVLVFLLFGPQIDEMRNVIHANWHKTR